MLYSHFTLGLAILKLTSLLFNSFFRNIKSLCYMKFSTCNVSKHINIRMHTSTKNNTQKLEQSLREHSEYST
jgi:hypothetical protein